VALYDNGQNTGSETGVNLLSSRHSLTSSRENHCPRPQPWCSSHSRQGKPL